MFEFIRRRLGAKLFVSYLVVILAGALALAFTATLSLPRAFNRHMGQVMATSEATAMPGQGLGQGRVGAGQGPVMMRSLYENFRASFVEALTLSAAVALAIAVVVSLAVSRSVVAPVQAMQSASRRIAAGHYDERVAARGGDELGQLAESFNLMAAELEQVEAMRLRLLGDVAHELRTPLTAIQGSAEALMDGVLPASNETYQQIHQEAVRLARLVDDLQELSRVEAGAYQLDLRPLDFQSVVGTVVKRMGAAFADRRVSLTPSLPASLPLLLADEDRLVQVLTNLVGNALQYTPEGGGVTICAQAQGAEVQMAVQDTGIGIPPEHLPRIFDRFYRVDKSRSRQRGGSGVGLTIAKYLVEAHGGCIWAESAGEGQGSTFVFTIPAVKV
jgi:histidine kinase